MSTPLSSRWTPFYKFILPVIVIGTLGFGTYYAWVRPERQHLPAGMPPENGWMLMAGIVVIAGAVIYWTVRDLVRLELDDDELIISDYRSEIRVRLVNIESISGRSLTDPKRHTISFTESTEFGRRVTFMPPIAWTLLPIGEHQAVVELRHAWQSAREAAAARR